MSEFTVRECIEQMEKYWDNWSLAPNPLMIICHPDDVEYFTKLWCATFDHDDSLDPCAQFGYGGYGIDPSVLKEAQEKKARADFFAGRTGKLKASGLRFMIETADFNTMFVQIRLGKDLIPISMEELRNCAELDLQKEEKSPWA